MNESSEQKVRRAVDQLLIDARERASAGCGPDPEWTLRKRTVLSLVRMHC